MFQNIFLCGNKYKSGKKIKCFQKLLKYVFKIVNLELQLDFIPE